MPPKPIPPEVVVEFTDHCQVPLFTVPELQEWVEFFEIHQQKVANSFSYSDKTIFNGLQSHPYTEPVSDDLLTRLQTRVRVIQSRAPSSIRNFNFAPGLWVALRPEENSTDDFWVAKIVDVVDRSLLVHWWEFTKNRWLDAGSQDKVAMGSVVACGFTFDPTKGINKTTLAQIYENL